MPLTRDDVLERIASRGTGEDEDIIDLRGADLTGIDLSGVELDGFVFGRGREGPEVARLEGANLRGATLLECSFTRCDLTDVDFRGATITGCDFRYVTTRRTNLAEVALRGCDFYRASFESGTIFRPSSIRHISLSNASLQGLSAFERTALVPGSLVQEDEAAYRTFLQTTVADSPESVDSRVDRRYGEAAAVYRGLSGLWTSQGLFGDSGWAYARSRELERRDASPFNEATPRRWLHWIGLLAAEILSGYGLKLGRVAGCLATLALLPGTLYAVLGGVDDGGSPTRSLGDCLLFSFGQITTSTPDRLTTESTWVEWANVVQTLAGISLLGLFGFVLGAVIRSS